MSKVAFMFPGQGAQYIGMGKDFYEQCPECKEVFDLASKASGLDVPALCFEENEQINITEYTQIAMLATEVAMLTAVQNKGYKPDVTAGLSLGEYGALAASGVMSLEDVFTLVRKRGIYMPPGPRTEHVSPALASRFFTTETPGKPSNNFFNVLF